LLPLAHAFAEEVYPYLLQADVNRVPFWMSWVWPTGPERGQARSLRGRISQALFLGMAFLPLLAVASFLYLFSDFFYILAAVFLTLSEPELPIVLMSVAASLVVLYYTIANFAYRPVALLFSPRRRREIRWRKRLAALLSERYGLTPGGLGLLL